MTAEATVPVTEISQANHGRNLQGAAQQIATLAAVPESPKLARVFVALCLSDWGFGPSLVDNAVLVVSELVTNAVKASSVLPASIAPIHVALSLHQNWLLIAVADASPEKPLLVISGPAAVSGRGIQLVHALSDRCGWYAVTNIPGTKKICWCEFQTEGR
jgi:anti-sigma regulatory factor (Ser/Thr protein kinase)